MTDRLAPVIPLPHVRLVVASSKPTAPARWVLAAVAAVVVVVAVFIGTWMGAAMARPPCVGQSVVPPSWSSSSLPSLAR
jgi:hypothetical protein